VPGTPADHLGGFLDVEARHPLPDGLAMWLSRPNGARLTTE